MNTIENGNKVRNRKANVVVAAAILIVTGLLIFFHKQGQIDDFYYRIVVSWPMLLVVLGAWSLARKQWYNAALLIGIGAFFFIPILWGAGPGWIKTYWPLLLVILGVLMLIGMARKKDNRIHLEQAAARNESTDTEDGFVYSDNTMSGVKHIVLDPVFKGASLKNHLGSTILDLRHTSLAGGDTFVDVECRLGGVEIFVPFGWSVVCDVQPVLAGCDDKRFHRAGEETEPGRRLIIRGKVTLGGIEIKN